MAIQLFANNASAKLAAAVAPTDTSFAVQTGQGAEFPALSGGNWFIGTLQSSDGATLEIVMVTARATDTMSTVVRAQEGTSAGTFAAGDTFDLRLTMGGLEQFVQALLDTDSTFAANSDARVASQKAIKTALALYALLASPAFTGNPTAPTQSSSDNSTKLATTAFVQAVVAAALAGFSWKQEVRARTTGALAANTYANGTAGVGATLTGNSNGALAAQDGVTLAVNDRLLVANEATGSHNGIYVVTQAGDGSHPYILTRASDVDTPAGLLNAATFVSEGTANATTMWTCSTIATITIGTTTLTFVQLALGSTTLAALTDALISSPANKDALVYNSGAGKWENTAQPFELMIAVTDETTAITTGAAKVTFRVPRAFNCTSARANLNTSSSSGLPEIDVKKNGTSIFSTQITIDASAKTSVTATTPAVLTSNPIAFADDDEVTIDINAAGTGAKGLKVTLLGTRS